MSHQDRKSEVIVVNHRTVKDAIDRLLSARGLRCIGIRKGSKPTAWVDVGV